MSEHYTDRETELITRLTVSFAKVINSFQDEHMKEFCVDDRSCMIQHSLCDILLSFIMAASESGYEKEVLDDIYEDVADAIELYSKPAGQMMN
jgi:hypothetical protein